VDGFSVASCELDVETNKVELLISLGRTAQHEAGTSVETVELALDNLAQLYESTESTSGSKPNYPEAATISPLAGTASTGR
jgi:hypothetical protein